MTEKATELSRALVVGQKRDGRNCYDPDAKRELIEACLKPGMSVAAMALRHGLNANLLRTWISRHQRERNLDAGTRVSRRSLPAVTSAFVEVVPPKPGASSGPPGTVAKFPNGVRLELGEASAEKLSVILRMLWELPCSGSTPG